MISTELARALRTAGLHWRPRTGDAFRIERDGFDDEIFTVSDMTIEAHEYTSGTILGFNGTTEWALDSVAVDDSLWLPREDQLRELLRGTFHSLTRVHGDRDAIHYRVTIERHGVAEHFIAVDAVDAYADALLTILASLSVDLDDVPVADGPADGPLLV